MTHEELEHAVPLYAAGALNRTERQTLEAHLLSGCASCHSALKDYQAVAASLPLGLSPIKPPRTLKAAIMAERNPTAIPASASAKEPLKPSLEPGEWMNHLFPPISPARSLPLPWAIGLVALLIVGVGGYFTWYADLQHTGDASKIQALETTLLERSAKINTLRRDIDSHTASLTELRKELEQRTHEAAEAKEQLALREAELEEIRVQLSQRNDPHVARTPQDELASLLRRPDIQAHPLVGSDLATGAAGTLLYDPLTHKIWLYAINLPESPIGTTYQLWSIDGKPVSIGTFPMNRGETTHLLIRKVLNFTATKSFAVSLEPIGGKLQPTGPMYLVSRS